MGHELEQAALSRYLEAHGLKHTRQREAILESFLSASDHITSEAIFEKVRADHPSIGYTTVYRTMKLLAEAGLAHERSFEDGITRYEIPHEHHDHLICTRCGSIVEFECKMIEEAQDRIAAEYGFQLLRHKHELYGHCPDCQKD